MHRPAVEWRLPCGRYALRDAGDTRTHMRTPLRFPAAEGAGGVGVIHLRVSGVRAPAVTPAAPVCIPGHKVRLHRRQRSGGDGAVGEAAARTAGLFCVHTARQPKNVDRPRLSRDFPKNHPPNVHQLKAKGTTKKNYGTLQFLFMPVEHATRLRQARRPRGSKLGGEKLAHRELRARGRLVGKPRHPSLASS